MTKKKILLTGFIGSKNIGDQAIFICILGSLLQNLRDVKIYILSMNPKVTVKLVRMLKGDQIVEVVSTRNLLNTIKCIMCSDIVISAGGGLLQDENSIYTIPKHLWRPILAKLCKKKVMIYAVGAGPIDTIFSKIIINLGLTLTDIVTTRDKESKEILNYHLMMKKHIDSYTDPAITLPWSNEAHVNEIFNRESIPNHKHLIGVTLRPWFYHRQLIPPFLNRIFNKKTKFCKDRYEQFIGIIAESLDYIVDKYGRNILFIPFYKDIDNITHGDVMSRMKNRENVYIIKGNYDPIEIKGIINSLKIMIGMRLHSIIFATSLAVPFIAIEYQPKISNYLNQLFDENDKYIEKMLKINIMEVNSKLLKERIDYVIKSSKEITYNLRLSNNKLIIKNANNIKKLVNFIEN